MDADGPSRRRWGRVLVQSVAVLLAVVLLAVGFTYRRQIVAYLTHLKGSPTHTEPYVVHDPPPVVHLAVAGDVGDSGSRIDRTGAAVGELGAIEPFDALLLLGDNVYPSGDPAKLPDTVFGPFAAVLDQGAELFAIVGNHDVKRDHAEAQMKALGMPGRWWSREIGNVLIVGMDSNDVENETQYEFVRDALDGSDAPWKIVAVHHPPYSAGYQGSAKDVRARYAPLFSRAGVQLVLSGHDHDYQRSEPMDGVTYVVSGAAAGTRRTGEDDFTAASFSWHHFVDVAVFDDRLVLRAVNQDLRVADEVVIER
jgi:hypothetical protein